QHWKASFGATDWVFVPAFGSDAPSAEVRFELDGATVGGRPVALVAGVPTCEGRRVSVARGGLVEVYDLDGRFVKQSFRFDELDERGELTVRVGLSTSLAPRLAGSELILEGAQGS